MLTITFITVGWAWSIAFVNVPPQQTWHFFHDGCNGSVDEFIGLGENGSLKVFVGR